MISNIAGGYVSNFDFDKPEIGSEIIRSANWIHAMTTIYQRVIKLVIFFLWIYYFLLCEKVFISTAMNGQLLLDQNLK